MAINQIIEEIKVLGVPVTVFSSYAHAVETIIDRIGNEQKTFCIAINPEKISRVQSDVELKELIGTADIHICDGMGTVFAARVLNAKKLKRVTGIQLFFDLVAKAEEEGLKIFILGASPESQKVACEKLLDKHPNLQIVGQQNGFFDDNAAIIRMINDSGADMLFVAMGSPKQEYWIAKHKNNIKASFFLGIGGTLDVVSGHAEWAPKLFRKTGTEFLYRLLTNPGWSTSIRFKRALRILLFVIVVMKTKLLSARHGV